MKMKAKKLALHRETLVDLGRNRLGKAAGGWPTFFDCPSYTCYPRVCQYSEYDQNTCLTCEQTCTSNYC